MKELTLDQLQEFDKIWNIENDYIVYNTKNNVWRILNKILKEYIYAKTSDCFKLSLINDTNYIYTYIIPINEYSTNIKILI
jgi:hypothetical protein